MQIHKREEVKNNLPKYFSPYCIYDIEVDYQIVGSLIVREGTDEDNYYEGHIGYTIEKEYQGHCYAYKACLLLKEELKLKYSHVLITCSPDNIASKKTIQKLRATYIETTTIPPYLRKYFNEESLEKEIYRWELINETTTFS